MATAEARRQRELPGRIAAEDPGSPRAWSS
jgi:hypothetical protein